MISNTFFLFLIFLPFIVTYRATWISYGNYVTSQAETQQTVQNLASYGVDTLFVDVWNQGVAYFNSPSARINATQGSDHLGWVISAAGKYNMQVIAWFEYGLIAAYAGNTNNNFYNHANNNGWILGTANSFIWMKPNNNDVLSFLCNLLKDALQNYPGIAGVQLDDHFAIPSSLGSYSSAMDSAAKFIWTNVRTVSNKPIWLSPAPLAFAKSNLNANWMNWTPYFTYFVPQLYYTSYSTFQNSLNTLKNQGIPLSRIGAGIRASGSPPTAWDQLKQMITYTQNSGVAGLSIWYVDGILGTYPTQFHSIWS